MVLYIAKQPNGAFAIFDDLSVRFVATKLRMGEAAALLQHMAGLTPERAWLEIEAASADLPLGVDKSHTEYPHSRIDDLLTAVELIRGRRCLSKELCAMGIPLYEPRSKPSEAILELYDCYLLEEADLG
jgi:hypothetical protein